MIDKNGCQLIEYIGNKFNYVGVIRIKNKYYVPSGSGVHHNYWQVLIDPNTSFKFGNQYSVTEKEYDELERQYRKNEK